MSQMALTNVIVDITIPSRSFVFSQLDVQISAGLTNISWYVGDPQNETMGRMGMLGFCSFGSP